MSRATDFDIAIIGAGPAGLCCALGLARLGYRIGIIERQPREALAAPGFDGREIALTHRSVKMLRELGIWERIESSEVAPLERAIVLSGASSRGLHLDPEQASCKTLGCLVSNNVIRRAAYAAVAEHSAIVLLTGCEQTGLQFGRDGVRVSFRDGTGCEARLLVAADSRFSDTRRAVGIAADQLDFGRCMLVCRFEHDRSHEQTACEWFRDDCTVATLPLLGNESSLVLTVRAAEARRLQALEPDEFTAEMQKKFQGRFGSMRLTSTRHVYPLVASYARRFVAPRCVLVGDAAVGMHPVTAHGFNLCLRSQDTLCRELRRGAGRGSDPGEERALLAYESSHRRTSRPLYLATNAIVRLYTDPRPLPSLMRSVGLRLADRMTPFKRATMVALTSV